MYIRSLEIQNLRTFESASVKFTAPGEGLASDPSFLPNVNLLLGDNGSGKTTVLRAAVLAALAPILTTSSGFVPFSLVRRARRGEMPVTRGGDGFRARVSGTLLLHGQDGGEGQERVTTKLERTRGWLDRFQPEDVPRWAEPMWDEESPAFFMTGYGAGRRVDPNSSSEELRSKLRALRYARVAGVFEEAVTMVPLSTWLPHLSSKEPDRHSEIVALLDALLAPHAKISPNVPREPGEDYLFLVAGAEVPFGALSDGYRAYVGWIADLLYHLSRGAPRDEPLVENRGVVLVDEVDLHLHPEWQQQVIPTVARALPNLQFIFTSHSPLVAGTVHGANLFVLDTVTTDGVSQSRLRPAGEEVFGLSADQILTSGTFGLASARNPDFTLRLQSQAQAASRGDPDAAVQFMRLISLGAAAEETSAPSQAQPAVRQADDPHRDH